MRLVIHLFFCYGLVVLMASCSTLQLDPEVPEYVDNVAKTVEESKRIEKTTTGFEWAGDEGIQNVVRRAAQMATIQWTPICNIPNNSGYYEAGHKVTGIPYSSTKKINKYVGFDVTYHTFMTAVHNPYSVLYTEHIGKAPYNGVNCACYYGTVCSAAVAYALGLRYPLISALYPMHPDFSEVDFQGLEDLEPGDVMHRTGHVFMIYRITKDEDGHVSKVTIFESAGTRTALKDYSSEDLLQRIKKEGIKPYRYSLIRESRVYTPDQFTPIGDESFTQVVYNDILCPNRGDKSVYRDDESVVIDVFDTSTYDSIVFLKDGRECFTKGIDGFVNDIGIVEPGEYKVYLRGTKKVSDYVELIVAAPKVSVSITDKVHISFECEYATPSYCVFATEAGDSRYTHVFNEEEINQGFADFDLLEGGPFYFKVIFETSFGTIINEPVLVNSI